MLIGGIISIVVLAALGWMIWLVHSAPLGWEDDQGFHTGEPDEHAHPDNLGI